MTDFLFAGLLALAPQATAPAAPPATEGQPLQASDWITMGEDCRVFAAGDVDGDGWADFLTINGNKDLCVARSVNGWKSANWQAIAGDVDPAAVGMAVLAGEQGAQVAVAEKARVTVLGGYAEGKFAQRRVAPAPEGIVLAKLADTREAIVVVDEQGGAWRVEGETLVKHDAPAAPANATGNASTDTRSGPLSVPGGATASTLLALSGPPYDTEGAAEIARLDSGFAPEGGMVIWS